MDRRINNDVNRTITITMGHEETRTATLPFPCVALIAFFIAAIIVTIIVLVITQKYPEISITSLQVSPAANDGNNSSTLSQSAAAADIDFSMVLRNKALWIEYDGIKASVYHQGNLLASTSLYPFDQGTNKVAEKKVKMRSMNVDQIVGKSNYTTFDINIISSHTSIPMADDREMNVLCEGIAVKFTNVTIPVGYMVGKPVHCRLDVRDPPAPDGIY